MSTLKIEERITVAAPPSRVWTFLLDPAKVAPCLPGARLDGAEGDATFLGTMKVKVGPVLMEFKGKATLTEVVEAERRVTMTGTGNDKSGGGSAKMVMTSRVQEAPGGGSEIVVEADVDLAGKLVGFGRGMMAGISKQLFKQFAERVQAELAQEKAEAPKAEEPPKEAPRAEEPPKEEPKVEEPTPEPVPEPLTEMEPRASASGPEPRASASGTEAPKVEEPPKKEPPPEKPAAPIVKAAPAPVAKEPEALDAGSLAWSALWAWIIDFFRRLFGRRR